MFKEVSGKGPPFSLMVSRDLSCDKLRCRDKSSALCRTVTTEEAFYVRVWHYTEKCGINNKIADRMRFLKM